MKQKSIMKNMRKTKYPSSDPNTENIGTYFREKKFTRSEIKSLVEFFNIISINI